MTVKGKMISSILSQDQKVLGSSPSSSACKSASSASHATTPLDQGHSRNDKNGNENTSSDLPVDESRNGVSRESNTNFKQEDEETVVHEENKAVGQHLDQNNMRGKYFYLIFTCCQLLKKKSLQLINV